MENDILKKLRNNSKNFSEWGASNMGRFKEKSPEEIMENLCTFVASYAGSTGDLKTMEKLSDSDFINKVIDGKEKSINKLRQAIDDIPSNDFISNLSQSLPPSIKNTLDIKTKGIASPAINNDLDIEMESPKY